MMATNRDGRGNRGVYVEELHRRLGIDLWRGRHSSGIARGNASARARGRLRNPGMGVLGCSRRGRKSLRLGVS